ncbi:hypothetical protein CPB83DRAFT_847342 [Crepidotus variabilis]|uniref:Uncharacterized protein n=1 Tax=Crepidotus variabilis TaxID=179855 RepID=A0A9P6ENL8_9AGAR|nr:hypothetical protein CPB83DRAFT_847342 [Crepidotus variabilis]
MAQVLNIHTPSSSFAIIHSLTQENLFDLYNKLSRKHNTDYYGEQVGPEWLKYEYNDSVWNLDDDSDYTIFGWRQQELKQLEEQSQRSDDETQPIASSSKTPLPSRSSGTHQPASTGLKSTPTLHLHNPKKPLPIPPEYCNPSYYVFHARAKVHSNARASSRAGSYRTNGHHSPATSSQASTTGKRGKKGKGGVVVGLEDDSEGDNTVPRFQKQFNRFHAENGVRTVMGSIGPVQNVRMLLKAGYRHVYISRKFAVKHEFIPADAAPGNYGYGGLVNIGSWPITLVPSASQPNKPATRYLKPDAFTTANHNHDNQHHRNGSTSTSPTPSSGLHRREQSTSPIPPSILSSTQGPKSTTNGSARRTKRTSIPTAGNSHQNGNSSTTSQQQQTISVSVPVYLSEEPHFDVVLGRSFFEKRQVKLSTVDPTDVVCLDTGEKIECELVVLKDGRGEIVTIT